QRRTDLLDPTGGWGNGDEVGLRKVPVVLRLLLAAPWRRRAGLLVEVPGLLDHPAARVENPRLSLDLGPDGALDRSQRVDVLGLRALSPPARPGRRERGVHVAAQRALLHPHV